MVQRVVVTDKSLFGIAVAKQGCRASVYVTKTGSEGRMQYADI